MSDSPTPERVTLTDEERLRDLLAAASPLPWRVVEGDLEGGTMLDYVTTLLRNRSGDGTSTGHLWLTLAPNDVDPEKGAEVVPAMTGDGPKSEANAALVVAAINALPGLLAREQALRDRVAELSAALDRVRKLHDQDTSALAPGDWCPGCGDREPCATKRAIRGGAR